MILLQRKRSGLVRLIPFNDESAHFFDAMRRIFRDEHTSFFRGGKKVLNVIPVLYLIGRNGTERRHEGVERIAFRTIVNLDLFDQALVLAVFSSRRV